MTLDELSSNKQSYQDTNTSTTQLPQFPRVPSPDIATILCRVLLYLYLVHVLLLMLILKQDLHQGPNLEFRRDRRVVSVSTNAKYLECHQPSLNRRRSEGVLTATKPTNITPRAKIPSSELAYLHKRTDSNATKPLSITKKSLSRSTSSTTTRSSVSACYDQEVEDSGC